MWKDICSVTSATDDSWQQSKKLFHSVQLKTWTEIDDVISSQSLSDPI